MTNITLYAAAEELRHVLDQIDLDAGAPLWRFLARHGATVRVVINVMHDKEAGVYVADSPNLRGFVAEAPTLEELKAEIASSVDELLTEQAVG